MDIRKLEEYEQSDPDAYNFSGGLCKSNQGIMEFVEMFKAPIKVLHPLLTASQEANYNGTEAIGSIPFDGIILAHSNEAEWQTFKNNKNNEAFIDRVYIVKIPYPKVIRDLKLFAIVDDDLKSEIEVTNIHDEDGYLAIREELASCYNLSRQEPDIQIYAVDIAGDRSMLLHHEQRDRIPLHKADMKQVMKHLHQLWHFDVRLDSIYQGKVTERFECNDEVLKEDILTRD